MRSALAIVLAVGACDRALGIASTQLADGPSPDAPPSCPALGMPPPFSPIFHQSLDRDCNDYTASDVRDLAVMFCQTVAPYTFASAKIDDANITQVTLHANIARPGDLGGKLQPGTDALWVAEENRDTATSALVVFARQDDATWTWQEDLFSLTGFTFDTSPPGTTPSGRRVLVYSIRQTITEMQEIAPGSWTVAHDYSASELGVVNIVGSLWLSGDATRMMFVAIPPDDLSNLAIYYADRPDPSATFGSARVVDGTPRSHDVSDPFMTENCGRLYFRGLGQILYLNLIY